MIQLVRASLIVCMLCFVFHSSDGQEPEYPFVTIDKLSDISYPYSSEIIEVNQAELATGYWIYYSVDAELKDAPLVIFMHGYGGYNPLIYGAWLRHIARQGNIVIYPRYQRNIIFPKANKFAAKASIGIQDALEYLKTNFEYQVPSSAKYVGHSYGGTIISELLIRYAEYDVPKPSIAMLCAPGTSALQGGRLDSYEAIDSSIKLLIVEENNDRVVGNEFSRKVFKEASEKMDKALIINYSQALYSRYYDAHHNVCYALDNAFDSKMRNYTTNRALEVGQTDELDYNMYWRLFDLMSIGNEKAFSFIYDRTDFPVSSDEKEGLDDLFIIHSDSLVTAPE